MHQPKILLPDIKVFDSKRKSLQQYLNLGTNEFYCNNSRSFKNNIK